MKQDQLRQLLKRLIRKNPDRFVHLMQTIESEPQASSVDPHDALLNWLITCLGDSPPSTETGIEDWLTTLQADDEDNLIDAPDAKSIAYSMPQNRSSDIRIPADDVLKSWAEKIIRESE